MKKQRGHFFLTLFLTFIAVSVVLITANHLTRVDSRDIHYEYQTILQTPSSNTELLPLPITHSHHRATWKEKLLFDVTYSIDQWGRRFNPYNPTDAIKSVVFFGCSMVFGAGLNDEQTLASFLAQGMDNTFVTSYAVSGNGPQHVLIDLFQRDFSIELPDAPAVFIYVAFIGNTTGHIQRLVGDPEISYPWLNSLPHVHYNSSSHELESSRSLYEVMSLSQKTLYKLFSTNLLLPLASLEWVRSLMGISSKSSQQKFIESLKWMNEIARKRGYPFFILFHPTSDIDLTLEYQTLIEKQTDIKIIKTKTNFNDYEKYRIPVDGHPTLEFNREFAKELAEKIPSLEI